MLPDATQAADRFHLVKLANQELDECRRRVLQQILGHRGHKADPLFGAHRLLTMAHERLHANDDGKLRGLPNTGDPNGEVVYAWHIRKKRSGSFATSRTPRWPTAAWPSRPPISKTTPSPQR